ncbi:MAG: polysaccharide deacetylase family protein [Acidobacteriota bacterium]
MYHSISDGQEKNTHPYYRRITAPHVFVEHMGFLHENNYFAVSLSEAINRMQAPSHDSQRRVVITFDDGYKDFYTRAFPILSNYGFGATVFLPTAYVGDTSLRFKGIDCLTWSQVRELRKAGVVFGSHTVNHRQLKALRDVDIEYEMRCSKQTIEEKLGCQVESFAYPFAFPETDKEFKKKLRDMLYAAGYKNGVSTIVGTAGRADDIFFMRRLPVNSCDDPRLLKAKLEGGYDWVHNPQYLFKLTAIGERFQT